MAQTEEKVSSWVRLLEDDDEDETIVYAYHVHELLQQFDEVERSDTAVQVDKDSFVPVLFRGSRCLIETPVCITIFNLTSYKNPGSDEGRYSIALSLQNINAKEMKEFRELLERFDTWGAKQSTDPHDQYVSAVLYTDDKKPPFLRVKVPVFKNKVQLEVLDMDGISVATPTVDEFREHVKHRNKVKAIIQVNPIWRSRSSNGVMKFGISYKLVKLKVLEEGKNITFR